MGHYFRGRGFYYGGVTIDSAVTSGEFEHILIVALICDLRFMTHELP